jgi:thiamine biosynthesis lipoprotein
MTRHRVVTWPVRGPIACGWLVLLLLPVAFARGDDTRPPRRGVAWTGRTMGTYVRVTLATADSAAASGDAEQALAVFRRVDSLMTNWTTTSEVARLNREAAAAPTTVHPEVATVLEASLRIGRESGGAFDITVEPLIRAWGFIGGPRRVPSPAEIQAALAHVGLGGIQYDAGTRRLRFGHEGVKIDLGGIAKGYAVDVAAETLKARGVRDALIDLSGNMVALGRSPASATSAGWRIGIRDPRDRIPYVARLTIHDEAISTSGQYEQFVAADGRTYGHILNPRTGWPATGLISVTVVSPTAMACDGWDTPLFVMGPEAARRQARALDRLAAVLIQPGAGSVDTMWVEETLRGRVVLEPAASRFIHIRYF